MKGHEFAQQAKLGPYAWPGGYPRYLVTKDGGVLCMRCVEAEKALIRLAAMTQDKTGGWCPENFDINWESALTCDHCNEPIEVAYPKEGE